MGNSPLTVCITQACNLERQMVQVVLPDGQVLYMPHPLRASMLMEAHPYHFVCQGSPSLLEQRLPLDTRLESGEIYYLLPFPNPEVSNAMSGMFPWRNGGDGTGGGGLVSRQHLPEKAVESKKPPLPFDKPPSSSSALSRMNLRPQQCLINLFLFRQSVASVMPEESFKPVSNSNEHHPPLSASKINSSNNCNYPRFESRPHRGVRGRKQQHAIPWKPHLASISETRPWHDFTTKNYINDFSVSMISSIKALASTPISSIPPLIPENHPTIPNHPTTRNHLLPPSAGAAGFGSPIHPALLPHNRSDVHHRQRFIYSA